MSPDDTTWPPGSTPDEVYDWLQARVDPGMHHEHELNSFYDRLDQQVTP